MSEQNTTIDEMSSALPKVIRQKEYYGILANGLWGFYCVCMGKDSVYSLPDDKLEMFFHKKAHWFIEYDWPYGFKAFAFDPQTNMRTVIKYGLAPTHDEEKYKAQKVGTQRIQLVHFRDHSEAEIEENAECEKSLCSISLSERNLLEVLSIIPREIIEKAIMWLYENDWEEAQINEMTNAPKED